MVNILSGYGTHKKTVGTVEWPHSEKDYIKAYGRHSWQKKTPRFVPVQISVSFGHLELKGIRWITSTYLWQKILVIRSSFQVIEPRSINWSTVASSSSSLGALITWKVEVVGSHLSFQMLIFDPNIQLKWTRATE